MNKLIFIDTINKIPPKYLHTPVQKLLEFHNMGVYHDVYQKPQITIGTCMDYRVVFRIPDKFAYIIRNGGSHLEHSDFHLAYSIAVGHIKAIAVIGHTDCGMLNLEDQKHKFIEGLSHSLHWTEQKTTGFFDNYYLENEIYDEVQFTLKQVATLREKVPNLVIAPFVFDVKDGFLYLIDEE